MLKKALRILLVLIITALVLIGGAFLAIRQSGVQSFIVGIITSQLSEDLGTQVRVESVDVDLWANLIIRGLYVEDQHRDTLLYVPSLRLRSYYYDKANGHITLNNAEFQSPYFRLVRYEGEEKLNYSFLLDYLSGDTTDTSASDPFVHATNIRIRNGSFRYLNLNRPVVEDGIDWKHLHLADLFLDMDRLNFEGDSTLAVVNDLSFREDSGFELKGFHSSIRIVPGLVELDNSSILTNHSHVKGKLAFQLNSIDDLDFFEERVKMNHTLKESVVELGDIGFFTSSLRGIQKTIIVSGRFKGSVANLRGKDVLLQFDRNSHFKGSFQFDGLPDMDQTFISCDIDELVSNSHDLRRIPLPPFDSLNYLQVPENFDALGQMKFKGNYTGFINDFVAFGSLQTAIGQLHSDIALKEDAKAKDYVYSGSLGTDGFDLGAFTGDPSLGHLTSELKVMGKGLTLDNLDATLDGQIQSIGVNGYSFSNIRADGTFRKRFFDGVCTIDDPHLVVDFEGQINLREKEPQLRFVAEVFHMDMKAIGIIDDFPYSSLSASLEVNSVGFDPDKFSGTIDVTDLTYCSAKEDYFVDHIRVVAVRGDRPGITVDSDIVKGEITGKFIVKELGPSFTDIVSKILPSYRPAVRPHRPQSFALKLDILDFSYISDIFLPELHIAPKTRISLSVDEQQSDLIISVVSDSISYESLSLEGLVLDARRPDESLYLTLSADYLRSGSSLQLPEFVVDAHTEVDSVYTDIAWGDESTTHEGDIKGKLTVRGAKNFDFDFGESSLRVNADNWLLSPLGFISMDSSRFAVRNFELTNGIQGIKVDGVVSEMRSDELYVDINALDLSLLNPFLGEETRLKGVLTSASSFRDMYHSMISNNDLNLINFGINEYEVGDVCVESLWDNAARRLKLDGEIQKGKLVPLYFTGHYSPDNVDSPLDIEATVKNLDLALINAFLDKEVLGIRGYASGLISVTGKPDSPLLEGEAVLQDAWVEVPYLNCSYQVMEQVGIYPDMFTFDHIGIRDEQGAPGFLTGQLIHNNFGEWSYDLVMDMDKPFLAMNTTEDSNPLYYGIAYASGTVNIYGYDEHIEFDINARTERGTKVSMPMNSTEEQSFGSFIRFVDQDMSKEEEPMDLSGIKMNFELEITPDAEFQIIFDEAVGDVMHGRGRGNINMEINNLSTFNMYGNVSLVNGGYLFTLKNLLNKEFVVTPGGTIAWYGDPFAADLNLAAVYKVSASLHDLMPDALNQAGQRVPVDLIMNLSGKMLNPGISFDIRLPTVDELTRSRVESIISTEQERNRQAFSLLVLRRFVAPPNITSDRNSANALAENSTELLSSQISNWLSQISDDFNLGFNYRPGDDISNEEIALALNTQLFNERLAISGNFGVSRGNEANQNPTNYIGDIRIEYKITSEGRIRLVVYNESNDFRQVTTQQSPYTQGVGVLYQEEFDTWDQFLCGFKQLFTSKDKRIECL